MVDIRFLSNYGSVQIAGGVRPMLLLTSVSGLSMPEKEVKYAVFKNIAGRKALSCRDLARKIKITGESAFENTDAPSVLYADGELVFKTERMTRKIGARCVFLSDRKTDGKFVIEFECDSPYFHDEKDLSVPVYSRVKLVETPFTLPLVFTSRIREGNCKNESKVVCEPVICLKNNGDLQSGITLTNKTTGVVISLSVEIENGGEVLIDIKNRTIVNDKGENLLPYLSETSYLHEFSLVPGDNIICLTANPKMECNVIYNTNYTEAVV